MGTHGLGRFCLQQYTATAALPYPDVQGELERALGCALQEDRATLRMSAAARTDAGVHAADQACALPSKQKPALSPLAQTTVLLETSQWRARARHTAALGSPC